MAEQGTAAQEQTGAGSASEVLSPADAERVYQDELNKTEAPAQGGDGKAAEGAGGEAGSGEKAADTKTKDDNHEEPAKEQKADEDAAELKAAMADLGLTDEDLPAELRGKVSPALKKIRQKYVADMSRERDATSREKKRADWWGDQNKKLSGKLKNFEQERAIGAPITTDTISKFREANKALISSLPDGTKRLWADDDYVASIIAASRLSMGAAEAQPAQAEPGSPGAPEPEQRREISAEERAKLEADLREQSQATAVELEKAGYKDFAKTYADPEFSAWIKGVVDQEAERNLKIFGKDAPIEVISPTAAMWTRPAAEGHLTILRNFDAYKAAKAESAKAAAALEKQKNALGGIGTIGGKGPDTGDLSADDILNMSDADFAKMQDRALSGGVRR